MARSRPKDEVGLQDAVETPAAESADAVDTASLVAHEEASVSDGDGAATEIETSASVDDASSDENPVSSSVAMTPPVVTNDVEVVSTDPLVDHAAVTGALVEVAAAGPPAFTGVDESYIFPREAYNAGVAVRDANGVWWAP